MGKHGGLYIMNVCMYSFYFVMQQHVGLEKTRIVIHRNRKGITNKTGNVSMKVIFYFYVNHPEVFTYIHKLHCISRTQQSFINPYPTAFPYGNGMVLHFYQQQESSTTKTVHKVINKGLKTYV